MKRFLTYFFAFEIMQAAIEVILRLFNYSQNAESRQHFRWLQPYISISTVIYLLQGPAF